MTGEQGHGLAVEMGLFLALPALFMRDTTRPSHWDNLVTDSPGVTIPHTLPLPVYLSIRVFVNLAYLQHPATVKMFWS